jgi:hypothetical protein
MEEPHFDNKEHVVGCLTKVFDFKLENDSIAGLLNFISYRGLSVSPSIYEKDDKEYLTLNLRLSEHIDVEIFKEYFKSKGDDVLKAYEPLITNSVDDMAILLPELEEIRNIIPNSKHLREIELIDPTPPQKYLEGDFGPLYVVLNMPSEHATLLLEAFYIDNKYPYFSTFPAERTKDNIKDITKKVFEVPPIEDIAKAAQKINYSADQIKEAMEAYKRSKEVFISAWDI